jgi:hypothetical protein
LFVEFIWLLTQLGQFSCVVLIISVETLLFPSGSTIFEMLGFISSPFIFNSVSKEFFVCRCFLHKLLH